ncbi:hypothetical protein LXL04_006271 [Taraxacum kok-saghyz]
MDCANSMKAGLRGFKLILSLGYAVLWLSWKERNERIFGKRIKKPMQIADDIHLLTFGWIKNGGKFHNLKWADSCLSSKCSWKTNEQQVTPLAFLDSKNNSFENNIYGSKGHNIVMHDLLDFIEKLRRLKCKKTKCIEREMALAKPSAVPVCVPKKIVTFFLLSCDCVLWVHRQFQFKLRLKKKLKKLKKLKMNGIQFNQ